MITNNIKNQIADVSLSASAIIAGISIFIMAIIAPIANFSILGGLFKANNAIETFNNILASTEQFRLGIFLIFIVAILDIIVGWALYIFLKPVNKSLSLLAAWFRIIYATLLIVVLFQLINILHLISGANYLTAFQINQLQAKVMLSFKNFFLGWDIGMMIFGLHLLLIGYLILKAGFMKKILGILIILASFGYLIDACGKLLFSNYNIEIAMFTFVGEVILIFWLLLEGRKIKESSY